MGNQLRGQTMFFAKTPNHNKSNTTLAIETDRDDIDLHLVSALLMFSVIRSDGNTDKIELAHMVDILRSRHALGSDEISNLLSIARTALIDDKAIEDLSKTLCKHWGAKERVQLLNDFWEIAIADEEIQIDERLTIELIANNLELEPDEITRARYHAEQRLELNIF